MTDYLFDDIFLFDTNGNHCIYKENGRMEGSYSRPPKKKRKRKRRRQAIGMLIRHMSLFV
jgi:hypothetical protein